MTDTNVNSNNQEVDLSKLPPGWDDTVDVSNLDYSYGNFIKQVDPSVYTNPDGTLKVKHPTELEFKLEYDKRYPKMNGIPVMAVMKNTQGDILEFKLASGQKVAMKDALRGVIDLEGMVVGTNQKQEPIIRSSPDGFMSNNLDSLPTYS